MPKLLPGHGKQVHSHGVSVGNLYLFPGEILTVHWIMFYDSSLLHSKVIETSIKFL